MRAGSACSSSSKVWTSSSATAAVKCLQTIEMNVERSLRDAGLPDHVVDCDRFHGLLGEQRVGRGNELLPGFARAFRARFRLDESD